MLLWWKSLYLNLKWHLHNVKNGMYRIFYLTRMEIKILNPTKITWLVLQQDWKKILNICCHIWLSKGQMVTLIPCSYLDCQEETWLDICNEVIKWLIPQNVLLCPAGFHHHHHHHWAGNLGVSILGFYSGLFFALGVFFALNTDGQL